MKKVLETLAAFACLMLLLPVGMLCAIFYDEDPADSYEMQNW